MFALMVAFSAAGIWSDAIQARGAVQREANSIENVVAIASSFPDEFREEVRREILLYARRTVQRDWPAMRRRAEVSETLFDRGRTETNQCVLKCLRGRRCGRYVCQEQNDLVTLLSQRHGRDRGLARVHDGAANALDRGALCVVIQMGIGKTNSRRSPVRCSISLNSCLAGVLSGTT